MLAERGVNEALHPCLCVSMHPVLFHVLWACLLVLLASLVSEWIGGIGCMTGEACGNL